VWTPFVGFHIRNCGLSADRGQVQNAFYLKDKNKLATRTFTLWDVSLDTEVDNETGETTERHFL
jgi:hypothetical protein